MPKKAKENNTEPIPKEKKLDLEKQGYRIVGNHSAVKVCLWTKKCLRDEDACYKNKFYGINSHLCIQMTPALNVCTHRCRWCWRDIDFTNKGWVGPVDDPKTIVDGCIKEHIEFLKGFGGNEKVNMDKYKQAITKPLHFAISLSGEPTFYPKLPELIDEIKARGMTAFLVTNGTNPEMLNKLNGHEPTQLYLTLPAPDKKTYQKVCNPLIKDGWEKIKESLKILETLNTRKTIRLTLVKDENMVKPEKYAELIKNLNIDFVEIKAYMWVGYSRQRMANKNMPLHEEIAEFAEKISGFTAGKYKIIDEKKESRVVLLARENRIDRIMKF